MNCQIFSTGFNSGDFGHRQLLRDMPSCLIEKNERMRSWRDRERDFLEMQGHGLAVAKGKDEPGAFSFGGADGSKNIGRYVGLY
jgi:hypothetical protein